MIKIQLAIRLLEALIKTKSIHSNSEIHKALFHWEKLKKKIIIMILLNLKNWSQNKKVFLLKTLIEVYLKSNQISSFRMISKTKVLRIV